jgi:hypothetical protein
MSIRKPSPELAAWIQRKIDEMDTTGLGAWPARECKEKLNALPIAGNQIYLWAIRPDGSVVCMDHESFRHETEEETDPMRLQQIIVEAAQRYPELQELLEG